MGAAAAAAALRSARRGSKSTAAAVAWGAESTIRQRPQVQVQGRPRCSPRSRPGINDGNQVYGDHCRGGGDGGKRRCLEKEGRKEDNEEEEKEGGEDNMGRSFFRPLQRINGLGRR
uniref:Uncharacterized protein n=1 Tax=Odontella aurita TaxID=265563 RepID=A0A7S4I644_9STRA|mmetsp:Transcript_2051/g.5407  ORF Transcript_2051/g.5407 Transcript_2051/m.5407 type:complete len:116 (+) Transcript_2051:138-485(+)